MLYSTCPRMLSEQSHSKAPPYLAVTSGPDNHSPPPIAAAPITKPGPIMASQLRQVNTGASISSAAFHWGICLQPGSGGTNSSKLGFCGTAACKFEVVTDWSAAAVSFLIDMPDSYRAAKKELHDRP